MMTFTYLDVQHPEEFSVMQNLYHFDHPGHPYPTIKRKNEIVTNWFRFQWLHMLNVNQEVSNHNFDIKVMEFPTHLTTKSS